MADLNNSFSVASSCCKKLCYVLCILFTSAPSLKDLWNFLRLFNFSSDSLRPLCLLSRSTRQACAGLGQPCKGDIRVVLHQNSRTCTPCQNCPALYRPYSRNPRPPAVAQRYCN